MEEPTKTLGENVTGLNREFSILNAISQTVNQSLDLDEILNNSLDRIAELTEACSAGFFLFDEGNNISSPSHQLGFAKTFSKGMIPLRTGEGLMGKVVLSGVPLFIEDCLQNSDANSFAIEEGMKSLTIIPLKLRAKCYGILAVIWKESHSFTAPEKDLFNAIGQIISGAMERASLYAENVRRLEEQRTLYAISQEIASRLELQVILQKIMESAVDLLEVEAGEITLWDNRRQNYVVAVVHGLPETLIGKGIDPPLSGMVGEICIKKAPVLYKDYERDPDRWGELDAFHFKEALGVPLIVRHMIIGTMMVTTSNPEKHFQQKEIDLLYNFAQQAAIAIGNAKLYEDSLSKIKQLTTLYEIGKTLSSTLDLDALLQKALELLKEVWGYALCRILLLDKEKDELYIKEMIGSNFEELKEARFRVGIDGIVGWVAKTGEHLYVPDVSKEPRYIPGSPEGKSEAAFPLRVRDQIIGVLDIESKELGGFDDEDLKVLSSFAGQVSISIENARLFSELKQTLEELKQTQDQIVQVEKLRALGEMASGVAHDFNNLLAVILGNIELLLHQLEYLSPEEVRQRLNIIERSSEDAAETVRRIQEFTGVRRDNKFTSLSVNEIVREVITITQPRWKDQIQSRGIQIDLTTQLEDVPQVFGNPSELREVLTNMIFNAVDAMPKGGKLTISTHFQGEWVKVRIADTGIGMTEEVKKRVFDPFFTTKGVGRSGLGMSVSYGVIKRHGGEILVESEMGKGTVFILHLPKAHLEHVSEPFQEISPPEVKPARILVIDDEDSVRDILSRMLKVKGHQVVATSNGEEGIERFKKEQFDLVFTDLGMPKVSGWEVGKAIKGLNPKVPVAMITGWGIELDRGKMNESGIDLLISKPFSFDRVIQVVSEAMELKERV